MTSASLPEGFVVGDRYRVLSLLGTGGMGAVYRARRLDDGEIVAVKVVVPATVPSPQLLARMEREVEVIKDFDHPSVVKLLDSGMLDDGSPFLVMAHHEGRDLARLTMKRLSSVDEARRIILDLGKALAYIHDHGVVHRDIKPANVLIDDGGRAILLDFGVAYSSSFTRMTKTGEFLGSWGYMAPEPLRGLEPSPRSDIYSLGVTVYFILTGTLPYSFEKLMLIAQLCDPPPPSSLRSLRSDVSDEFSRVIMRCLALEPAERFATAQDLIQAVSRSPRLAASMPLPREQLRSVQGSLSPRARWFLILIVCVLVGAFGGFVVGLLLAN